MSIFKNNSNKIKNKSNRKVKEIVIYIYLIPKIFNLKLNNPVPSTFLDVEF